MVKKVKKRIRWKAIISFAVTISLLLCGSYLFSKLPMRHILITGTEYLTDKEIIEVAGIKEYPKLITIHTSSIKEKIKSLEMVNDVTVHKYLNGTLKIEIDEAIPLFISRINNMIVLSNGTQIPYTAKYATLPFLVNMVPDTLYERLLNELKTLKQSTRAKISEMEYSRATSGEEVIDDTRFIFRMTDGNTVLVNLIHMNRMDMYEKSVASSYIQGKGCFHFDSSNEDVILYKPYEEGECK